MIKNYDYVVACDFSGTTNSQEQRETSYTATKRTWFSFLSVFLMLFSFVFAQGQSTANYAFSTNATGSLVLDANGNAIDMSAGTTQLVGADLDDSSSPVTNIGFNFFMYGNFFNQFSASSNGVIQLGTSQVGTTTYVLSGGSIATPRIGALSADLRTGSAGKVHYKIVGSSPNRCLVVEFNNMSLTFVASPGSNDGTYQVRLYESSGIIEYVYGSMFRNASTTTGTAIYSGFSVGTALNTTASITTSTNTVSNGATFNLNSYTVNTNISNLHSTTDGSRRIYKFTPPVPASGPSGLIISAVSASGMTLDWTAASPTTNIVRYAVLNSTNGGATYNFVANVALGTNTYNATGLIPETTYDWKVVAISEGVESTPATGTQTTSAASTYYWIGTSSSGAPGAFATLTNWNTAADGSGSTPASLNTTDVFIVDGDGSLTTGGNVYISFAAATTVGQLKIKDNTACYLQSSATTQRIITIYGGSGDDFVIESGSSLFLTNTTNSVSLIFSSAVTGNTGNISGTLTVAGINATATNAGANSFLTTGGNGTIVSVTSTGVINNIATTNITTNGNVTGSASTLLFLDGSQYNVSGATTGAPWVPLATWSSSSTLTISGLTTSATAPTNNNQSFGNIVYNCPLSTATLNFFGANTQIVKGNLTILAAGATGGTGIFRVTSTGTITVNGDIVITQGRFQSATTGTVIANGLTTIDVNGILDTASTTGTFSQRGATLTNNGILTGTTGTLQFLNLTGSFAQTLAGSGTVLTNLATLTMQNTAGLTITHTNPVIIARANLFQGTITGSDKITFGTGLAVACTTQIGAASLITPGGSFDANPNFNLGTGTYALIYAQESVSRTVGFEVPPTRLVSSINLTNSNGLVLSGGNLGTGTLTFGTGSGNITTNSANVLTVTGTTAASIVRTSTTAYVNGPLARTLPPSLATGSTYVFPIGKSTINPFELVNPTTGASGNVVIQSEVFDSATGGTPGSLLGSLNSNRYWATSFTSGGSNFADALVRLNDNPNGADAIGSSETLTGTYDLIGGLTSTVTASSIATTVPEDISALNYYVMASKASPILSNLLITPTGSTCLAVTRTVTVDVAQGAGAITGVVINYSINGIAQTAIAMTNTSGTTWSGTIPVPTPSNATIAWSVTATDVNMLTITQAGATYSDEPTTGLTASATASNQTVCAGGSTTLTVSLIQSGSKVVSPTLAATTASSYSNPIYSNWANNRSQILILGSELIASGFVAGNITSMSFPLTSTSATTRTGYTIKIGATTTNALTATSFLSPTFTTVYSANYVPVVGTNIFTFTTPFAWDGNSNIVIETCWDNTASTATESSTATAQTTSFNSVVSYNRTSITGTSICGLSNTPSATYTNRPLITLGGTIYNIPNTVSWSDGTNIVGTTNPLVVLPTANTTYTATASVSGCPITASTTVNVNPLPTAPTATNSAQCGTQMPTASVVDTNGFTTPTFNWYEATTGGTALQSSTSTTYMTAISETTTFYVSVVNPITSCESARTPVTITASTPDLISASTSAATICLGQSAVITASNTASSPLQNYTYSWLSTTGSGVETSQTGASITVTPTAAGTYTYTATAVDGGCQTTNTVIVTVNPLPTITTTTASPMVACEGSTINLAASIIENGPGSKTLGLGVSTSTSAAANPFYGGYGGVKTQYLIRASELTALGITAGNITSLGINVTTAGSTLSGFRVNMDSTLLTALTSNIEDVSNNVFSGTFVPSIGINTITFSSPFNWDGTSNIILSFCWSNANTSNTASTVRVDTTPFVSANARYVDSRTASEVCDYSGSSLPSGWNGTSTSLSTRPQFIFTGRVNDSNTTANYTWSWSDGTSTVLTSPSGSVTLPSGASTTYTVTATNPSTGCIAFQSVVVSTNVSALAVTATPSSSNICVGSSVTLTASPTGGCIPYSYSWSDGTSVVGTSDTLIVSPLVDTSYTVTITDNTGANVSATSNITINDPQPLSVAGETKCTTSATFTLEATVSNVSSLLNWYAASTGGPVLSSGATFTTPLLSTTTTYYVEENEVSNQTNGLGRVSTTSISNTAPSTYGLVFDLNRKAKLNSVDVYLASATAGSVVLQLQNSTGTVINSKTVTVPAGNATTPVQYTLPIDFIIPAGTGYRLLAISGPAMVRESALGGFPYSLGTFGNITNGYISGTSTAYYYFYNWSLSDVCSGTRVPVVATLNTPPTLTLSSTTSSICNGDSSLLTLTVGGVSYDTFVWSPSTTVTGNSTTGWEFSPTTTTTYILTASQSAGSCSTTASYTVTVNSLPTDLIFTPSDPTICVDAIQELTVSGGILNNAVILSENFNGVTNSWVTQNNSTGTNSALAAWTLRNSGYSYSTYGTFSSNDSSQFYLSNSDAPGSGSVTDTALTSPSFSTLNYTAANISFWHYFRSAGTAKVQYSINGGTSWIDIQSYTATTGAIAGFVQANLVLPAGALNQADVKIRFKYDANWQYFWAIDNVMVSGSQNSTITWSPTTNLYTNAAATIPYTAGTNTTTVYVKSSTAGVYTYEATATVNGTGCANGAAVSVTVNANTSNSTTTSACGSYTWAVNGQTYTDGGTYTNVVGCHTETLNLTINALPDTDITRTDDTLTVDETGVTYQWVTCDGGSVYTPIGGATNQSYTVTAVGSYAVEVTKNGCTERSACFDVTTLSNNSFDLTKLVYYPNPVVDRFTVTYTSAITAIQVYDISGRLVKNITTNSNEVNVDMSDVAASVYIVKVFADNTMGEFKVIKKE